MSITMLSSWSLLCFSDWPRIEFQWWDGIGTYLKKTRIDNQILATATRRILSCPTKSWNFFPSQRSHSRNHGVHKHWNGCGHDANIMRGTNSKCSVSVVICHRCMYSVCSSNNLIFAQNVSFQNVFFCLSMLSVMKYKTCDRLNKLLVSIKMFYARIHAVHIQLNHRQLWAPLSYKYSIEIIYEQ